MSKYDELRRLREARYAEPATIATKPIVPAKVIVAEPPAPLPEAPARFDRNAYHREYMRAYMRKRRARPAG